MTFNYKSLESFKYRDDKLEWFYDEIVNIKNRRDLSEFIELYLEHSPSYFGLRNQDIECYFDKLANFLTSAAAERELKYENEWQNFAFSLLISVERE